MQTKEWHIPLPESVVMFSGGYFAKPDKTYGFAKLAGEYLADFAAREYGLDVRVFRPFGGYGEDQDMNYPFSFDNRGLASCRGRGSGGGVGFREPGARLHLHRGHYRRCP